MTSGTDVPTNGNQLRKLAAMRWIRAPFALGVLGRLPLYMTSAALVLWTAEAGRSALLSGFYVAVLNIGVAVAGPWLGHLSDGHGRAPALRITGIVELLSLGTLPFISPSDVAPAAVLCLLAGAATPPISSALRSLAADCPREDQRVAIFTGEALFGSGLAVAGPLMLSAFLLLGGARWALGTGAVLSGGSALALSTFAVIRARAASTGSPDTGDRAGALAPLRQRGFRALTVRMVFEAVSGGAEQVAVPVFALSVGSAALTGPLWAIPGGVGLAAGAAYAVRTWSMPKETLYCLGVTGLALAYLLPALAGSFVTMVLALSVGAVLGVPVIASEYELISRTVPEHQRNASFALMTSAAICGTAIGAQLGGLVIVHSSYRGAFVFAAVFAGIAALMSWRSRRLWSDPPPGR